MERNFCGIQYTACPDSGTIRITNQPSTEPTLKTILTNYYHGCLMLKLLLLPISPTTFPKKSILYATNQKVTD
jgi:hypothetical protein